MAENMSMMKLLPNDLLEDDEDVLMGDESGASEISSLVLPPPAIPVQEEGQEGSDGARVGLLALVGAQFVAAEVPEPLLKDMETQTDKVEKPPKPDPNTDLEEAKRYWIQLVQKHTAPHLRSDARVTGHLMEKEEDDTKKRILALKDLESKWMKYECFYEWRQDRLKFFMSGS